MNGTNPTVERPISDTEQETTNEPSQTDHLNKRLLNSFLERLNQTHPAPLIPSGSAVQQEAGECAPEFDVEDRAENNNDVIPLN